MDLQVFPIPIPPPPTSLPWGFKGGKDTEALMEEDPCSASSAITFVSVLLMFGSVIFFSPDCTLNHYLPGVCDEFADER